MKFNYQARTKTGKLQSGVVEATSEEAALAVLQRYELYITTLREVKQTRFLAKEIKLFGRVSRKDNMMFSRQLSIMFKSKIPLVEALRVLVAQTPNLYFQDKILKIAESVEGGAPLSRALSLFPDVFSTFFVAMVKSGETAGKLSEALEYLADHLDKENTFYSKVWGALLYPIMIMVVMLGVIAVMIFFVFPQINQIVEDLGVEPPLLTKILFGAVDFFKKWLLVILLAFIASVFFMLQYVKSKEGRNFFSKVFLKLPALRNLVKMIYLSRFAGNLSTLMTGGVPIAQALEVAGEVVGNEIYKKIILETRDEVRKGETISNTLSKYPDIFPPLFAQMTLIGEKTGTLDQSLMHLVTFYEKEVDRNLENFLSLLVPFTMIFLGVIVGGLVGSVLLTLYKVVGGLGE